MGIKGNVTTDNKGNFQQIQHGSLWLNAHDCNTWFLNQNANPKIMKIVKSISIASVAVLIIVTGVFLFHKWKNNSEDEVFVLPEEFIGPVMVHYNTSGGQPERYLNSKRVYDIPKEGVLKTEFKYQEGFRQITYLTANGRKLRYLWPSDAVWRDTANINSLYKDSVYVYKATTRGDFIVGKPHQLNSLYEELEKRWLKYSIKRGDSIRRR